MSFLNALLPHFLAKRIDRVREFQRVGLNRSRALELAMSVHKWSSYIEARINLLPSHFQRDCHTIVDVGANVGNWSSAILTTFNFESLIALEPNPAVFDALCKKLRVFKHAKCVKCGVSSQRGELPFYITSGSQCASVLKPNQAMSNIYGSDFDTTKTITVPVDTLDHLLAEITEISLLKIDVQGFEREVLRGAGQTLHKTKLVLIEANFVSHYENDICFPELDALMNSFGFALSNLSPPFQKNEFALWADALYRKR